MKLKPVCLLLSLCHAGSAAAFGLGEINVRSYLGQPLHASVALIDAPAALDAECFSVEAGAGGIAPLPRTRLNIDRSGEQAVLNIHTSEAVNDPVAQFVLRSACEPRLQRDYVVLLDPPDFQAASVSPAAGPQAETATQAEDAAEVAAGTSDVPPPAVREPRRAKRAAPAVTRPASSGAVAAPNPSPEPAGTTARLVLSGKHHPALRQETPDAAAPATPPGLSPAELSDENTALNRRLAHLEAQLAQLRQRHAELEARNAAAARVAAPPPEGPAQWPFYLLGIGLLAAAAAGLIRLLQRRRPAHRAARASLMTQTAPQQAMPALSGNAPARMPEPAAAPQRMPDVAPPPPRDDGTELKEDILDQAEVFMAHGHGELAIHLLQEHLRAAPTESAVPWLLLLDLLLRASDRTAYVAACDECRRYFNINLNQYDHQGGETSQGLAAYQHVAEQLVRLWNTPGIDGFLNELIFDDRGGTRQGFTPLAYREILLLQAIVRDQLLLAA